MAHTPVKKLYDKKITAPDTWKSISSEDPNFIFNIQTHTLQKIDEGYAAYVREQDSSRPSMDNKFISSDTQEDPDYQYLKN